MDPNSRFATFSSLAGAVESIEEDGRLCLKMDGGRAVELDTQTTQLIK
jgi:hypothetical protein